MQSIIYTLYNIPKWILENTKRKMLNHFYYEEFSITNYATFSFNAYHLQILRIIQAYHNLILQGY